MFVHKKCSPPSVCLNKLVWNIAELATNSLKFYQTCTQNHELFGILVENSHTTPSFSQELERKQGKCRKSFGASF